MNERSFMTLKANICFSIVFICILSSLTAAKPLNSWPGLKTGPYSVGYKVIETYDYSRSFRQSYDYLGNSLSGEQARPVQLSVWYPAKHLKSSTSMKYVDYILKAANEITFSPLTDKQKKKFLNQWKPQFIPTAINSNSLNNLLSIRMNGIENCEAESGKFPLILYGSSINSSPYENAILIEYIVSHGYIVASCPSNGVNSGIMSMDWIGVEAQIRDIEFIMSRMKSFPGVDYQNIGALGFSWGGLAISCLAVKNHFIDVVLCLDGGVSFGFDKNKWEKYVFYTPEKVRAPYMLMVNQDYKEYEDWEFINGIKYAPTYLFKFNFLRHGNFCSSVNLIQLEILKNRILKSSIQGRQNGLTGKFQNKDRINSIRKDRILKSYEIICRYTKMFFDSILKNDLYAKQFIKNALSRNKISGNIVSQKRSKALPIPPNEKEFFKILKNHGLDKAVELFRKYKANDPEVYIFSENSMNRIGYLLLNAKRFDNAILIFQLNTEAFPNSSNVFDSLGEAYMKSGNLKLAKKNYLKSLQLNAKNKNAAKMLKKLKKNK